MNFEIDYELITVHYAGGPFSGDKEQVRSIVGYGPPVDGVLYLHGTLPDSLLQSWYGPITYDEETHRWIRQHGSTEPVEQQDAG